MSPLSFRVLGTWWSFLCCPYYNMCPPTLFYFLEPSLLFPSSCLFFISTLFSVCIAFCTPKCWCIPLLLQPHLCVATTFHNCSSYTLNYGIDIPCVECQLALPFSLTVDSPVHLGVFVVFPINVHGFLLHLCKPFACWRWRHAMPPDIECEYERKGEENENERGTEPVE